MSDGILGTIVKVVAAVVVVALSAAGILWLKNHADDENNARPDAETVIDQKSGLTWEMFGTPEMTETTSDLVIGAAEGNEATVRVYTVDHGDWVERVQVIDVAPGEMDFTEAALTTFDAPEGAELGDLEFVKVAGFDGATGRAPGTIETDGSKAQKATTQVFASQVHSYLITGGVAQVQDSSEVDVADEAETLRESIHEP